MCRSDTREFQAVQEKADLAGRAGADFDAVSRPLRKEGEEPIDCGLATLDGRGR